MNTKSGIKYQIQNQNRPGSSRIRYQTLDQDRSGLAGQKTRSRIRPVHNRRFQAIPYRCRIPPTASAVAGPLRQPFDRLRAAPSTILRLACFDRLSTSRTTAHGAARLLRLPLKGGVIRQPQDTLQRKRKDQKEARPSAGGRFFCESLWMQKRELGGLPTLQLCRCRCAGRISTEKTPVPPVAGCELH